MFGYWAKNNRQYMHFTQNKLIEQTKNPDTKPNTPTHLPYFGLALGYTFQLRIIWVENMCRSETD